MTIHSWSGIGLGAEDAETLATKVCRNKVSKQRWNAAKILVIDEISMLSADLFDKLNIIGQRVRDCNELFGGIQLVLCGDFFQVRRLLWYFCIVLCACYV
jgi:ATP-dependent DNA helicase PIF1